jgi:hypothetical protein
MKNVSFMVILIITASLHIGCQQRLRPQEKAIRLVEESNAFEGGLPVKVSIDAWMKQRGNEVRPMGWRVTKKEDQIYLVGYEYRIYSFTEGSGETGFFFEVNLATKEVRNVTQREAREMGSLAPPLTNDKDIPEELLDEWEDTQRRLSGGDL